MSLDFYLERMTMTECFSANITHNLSKMAEAAGIYKALWCPDEINAKYAKDIIGILETGLAKLKANPKYSEQYDSSYGWGLYVNFVPFVERVLAACKEYPEAEIRVSR